jgi:hypothetical protein
MRKVDSLNLIFIDFYVQALIPLLNNTETSQQQQRQADLDRHPVYGDWT